MELRQLRYFQTTAEIGSITRAAEALYIAQPALSQQIMKLETELGVRLFNRSVRGVATTQAGDTLYRLTKPLLRQADTIAASVREQQDYTVGRFVIGMPGSTGKILAERLVRQMRNYPGILLEIVERSSADLLDLVVKGRVDMAIAVDVPRRRDIVSKPVLLEELYVVRPSTQADEAFVEIESLAAQPAVLPSQPSTIRQRIDTSFLDARLTFNLACEVSSTDIAIRLVNAGLGWTVLPWSAVGVELEQQRVELVRIKNHRMQRHLSLCFAKDRPHDAALRIVQERTASLIDDAVQEGHWRGVRFPKDT